MHKMEELKEMLCEELDKITKKGELSAGSLDVVDKLTHSIKSIATIIAMEEAEGGSSYEGGYSGARGRGRGARRDSMGRYSRDGGSYGGNSYDGSSYGNSYGGSYMGGQSGRGGSSYGRGYSRDDAKEELMESLHELMASAEDERTKKMVRKWIEQAERDA